MPVIDVDGHVVETEHTWDFMDPSDSQHRPYIAVEKGPGGNPRQGWVVDGKMVRAVRSVVTAREQTKLYESTGREVSTPDGAAEMEDVGARLRHMDELGIDLQVLHSTLFITPVAFRPEVDAAVCRGYNRWLADIWRQSEGRLRYAAVLPLLDIDAAIEELRDAVKGGACAAAMRPIETEKLLTSSYFYPLYEEASRLNVPMAMHIGYGNPLIQEIFGNRHGGGSAFGFRLVTVAALHWLVWSQIPDRFPTLRWGFFEASADWLPWVLKDLRRRYPTQHQSKKQLDGDILGDRRIWVACEAGDDLPYVLKHAGEDNLVIGTDYGHTDQASELDALKELGRRTGIAQAVMNKILCDNPAALFGF